MLGYGLPRRAYMDAPDAHDAALYGRKSRIHTLKSKNRRRTRRMWKKKERAGEKERLRIDRSKGAEDD